MLIGPHGTRYREQTLAAVQTLAADQETRQSVIVTMQTYVVGQITFALDEAGAAEAGSHSPQRRHTRPRLVAGRHRRGPPGT